MLNKDNEDSLHSSIDTNIKHNQIRVKIVWFPMKSKHDDLQDKSNSANKPSPINRYINQFTISITNPWTKFNNILQRFDIWCSYIRRNIRMNFLSIACADNHRNIRIILKQKIRIWTPNAHKRMHSIITSFQFLCNLCLLRWSKAMSQDIVRIISCK